MPSKGNKIICSECGCEISYVKELINKGKCDYCAIKFGVGDITDALSMFR